jgi:hypothetical protein
MIEFIGLWFMRLLGVFLICIALTGLAGSPLPVPEPASSTNPHRYLERPIDRYLGSAFYFIVGVGIIVYTKPVKEEKRNIAKKKRKKRWRHFSRTYFVTVLPCAQARPGHGNEGRYTF